MSQQIVLASGFVLQFVAFTAQEMFLNTPISHISIYCNEK